MEQGAPSTIPRVPISDDDGGYVSRAYLDGWANDRKELEPVLLALDAKVTAHRATPEYKAYRAAKDAEKAAALKGII